MAISLDTIAATLDALKADNQREHDRILSQLGLMNGQVDRNRDDLTRLKEQSTMRASMQGIFTVIAAALAAWLGIRH